MNLHKIADFPPRFRMSVYVLHLKCCPSFCAKYLLGVAQDCLMLHFAFGIFSGCASTTGDLRDVTDHKQAQGMKGSTTLAIGFT